MGGRRLLIKEERNRQDEKYQSKIQGSEQLAIFAYYGHGAKNLDHFWKKNGGERQPRQSGGKGHEKGDKHLHTPPTWFPLKKW